MSKVMKNKELLIKLSEKPNQNKMKINIFWQKRKRKRKERKEVFLQRKVLHSHAQQVDYQQIALFKQKTIRF